MAAQAGLSEPWLTDLVRHGLIAKSFVPPARFRESLRYRRKLIEAQAAERNRLLRLLEAANTKLASVMSDVFTGACRHNARRWQSCGEAAAVT